MDLLPLAVAQELVFLGAALAVTLLLVFQLRLAQRFRTLDLEVERLSKAHKDGTLDARSRLEEASRSLEALEESVTPRLAALEPNLIELGARLDEMDERISRLVPELEAAGRRETEASEVLADARTRLEQAEEAARVVGERFGAMEEGARDASSRIQKTEHGLDYLRTTLDERLEALDRQVGELKTVPAAAPRQPTRTALGLVERREAKARRHASGGDGEDDGESASDPEPEPAAATDTAQADEPEDLTSGMRYVLIGVIVLAAVTMLLRWMGVGR